MKSLLSNREKTRLLADLWYHANGTNVGLSAGYIYMRVSQIRLQLRGLKSTVKEDREQIAQLWKEFMEDLARENEANN